MTETEDQVPILDDSPFAVPQHRVSDGLRPAPRRAKRALIATKIVVRDGFTYGIPVEQP